MASKFGLAGGIPERRVRPIWDAIDSRQFKTALKHVTQLLSKFPNSPYAVALKALILERMGKPDEALSICLNAKELLYSNDSFLMDDLTLSTLQIVLQRLDHLDLATSCYEYACGKFPNNLELMMGLFNCYVREYSFVKQQQTAIKMYKLVGEERFLLWAVCSIQLQVLCGSGGEKLPLLAEGLLKKHVASHGLHEPEALMVYISILEQQAKYGDALEILSGKLGSLLTIEVDKLRIRGRLHARAGDYAAAADVFQKVLESCPDDWETFLHYLGCLLENDCYWCIDAIIDHIYPPKFVNCKKSPLTDELFDTRISEAATFVQKLQSETIDNSFRCPYLATIEIERQKHLNGKGNADKLIEALVQYFYRFGHLASFTSDVEMFVELLSPDKKAEFLENLMRSETLSTVPARMLGQLITLFKIRQHMGNMFKSSVGELKVSSVQMADMYCKNLHLSKDLDPQESMHGDELLSMTCNVLVQLFWRTKDLGYLIEAIMVLELGLSIRRYVWQYKILLLHLYSHLGSLPVAFEWYKSLDVKNILTETSSHQILPQMLVSPHWIELNNLLKDYIKFMDDHLKESADLTFLAYRQRNYSKVIEFVQFKERLQHSSQYLMARVEESILLLKQSAENIEEVEAIFESLKLGTNFLELSSKTGSKSLTFNEDLDSRPWWTPIPEKDYLLEPFEGVLNCSRENLRNEREASLKRNTEKRSLLPRMIYLSVQSASTSLKEHIKENDSLRPKIFSELKLLLERYTKLLGYSLSEAMEKVASGKKSPGVFGPDLVDWLNFAVFLNAWSLNSPEVLQLDGGKCMPHTWQILNLFQKYILEKFRSMEHQLCTPWADLPVLVQLVTEPLAWHGLVIQSFVRSSLPSGKKKKKSGPTEHLNSNLPHIIRDSVQLLSSILEEAMKWIKEWIDRSEDANLEDILLLLQRNKQNEGPGQVLQVLESFISSMDDADIGDRISHSLRLWSPADVARKMVTGKCKVLKEFMTICEAKFKLYQGLKQRIAQL